ncbi:MAG: hypothetical protein QM530_05330 [Phycisphaerales bacterium]|nr:hypothetical protein [Phycisphaerales bacterium]
MLFLSLFIAFIVSFAFAWLIYRSDKKRAIPKPIITSVLRGLVVFLSLLLLTSPKINKHNTEVQKPIVLLLQDNSESIKNALGGNASLYHKKLNELNTVLSKEFRLVTWNLNGAIHKDSLDQYKNTSTNIAKAISDATELYGQQNLSALIVASDGWYNEGNNPLYSEIPLNGSLYSIAIGDTTIAQDIRIAKVYANRTTTLNSQWEIRVDIIANRCAGIAQNISLSDAAGNMIAQSPININTDRFDATISFSVKANKAGLQQYKLSIPKTGVEPNLANNSANVFVDVVAEKKKILLVAAAPHPDIKAIEEAMKSLEQYELVVKLPTELPNSFNDYACVILHQLPSNNNSIPEELLRHKSVWYIAGLLNNYAQLNSLQQAVRFGMGVNMYNVEAQYNNGFNSFILPNNMAAISDILPPLSVSASDRTAAANAQTIWNDKTGKPLWTIVSGNTPTAVVCGEGIWRWRMYEYKNTGQHQVVDECIRQTIIFLTADNNTKPFRTELPKYVWTNNEHVRINAFLYNQSHELVNDPNAEITIKDSLGNTRKYTFEKNGNAYRIDIGALAYGSYTYTSQTKLNEKVLSDAGHFVVEAIALENQESGCNYPLMYALAQKNKGCTFNTKNMLTVADSIAHNSNIKPLYQEQIEAADLIDWKWIFALIVLMAAAEWLLRKYWMAM